MPQKLIVIFLLLILTIDLNSCRPKKLSEEEKLSQKLDSLIIEMRGIKYKKLTLIFDRLHQKGLFNGNVLVSMQGKILFKKNYGFADFRNNKKLTDDSSFRIASLNMQFTAMAILILAEKKKLKLEDTLQKFYPGLNYPPITIHQLLTHTSGLFTYANNQNVISWILNDSPSLEFLPGTSWGYSNTGYVFLAEIIEKITKRSFSEFLDKNIFQPLDMKNTFLMDYALEKKIPNKVYGFYSDNITLNDDNFLDRIYGNGGMYASINDLYKWDQALYTEKLVKKETLHKAFTPVDLYNGVTYDYGYGWHLKENDQGMYHLGAWLGFRSAIMRIPRDKNTIIILSNNMNPVFNEIVEMVYNIMYNKPYKIPH